MRNAMREITIKFKEFSSDVLAKILYNPAKHDFVDTINLAQIILYNLADYSFEDMKDVFGLTGLTEELYELAAEVLDYEGGVCDVNVTIEKFLEFLSEGFGWECEIIATTYVYDISEGNFVNE